MRVQFDATASKNPSGEKPRVPMGYYRLILALLVTASHAGLAIGRFNLGEIAVVSFFLMSGYVMTALIDRHYRDLRRVGHFYLDRALRLYPQFLVYSLAMIAAAEIFGLRHQWMPAPPTLTSDFAQLTMLPLAFSERFPNMLLPQAWSLGLELMFYAVFPFFLIPGERMMAAYASGLVFLFAFCGRISADWFAYRLLPGVLFVFILGSWVRKPEIRLGRAPLALGYALAVAALVVALTIWPRRTSVCDMLIGLVAGLPIVYGLSRARIGGWWDGLAGDLSYGVFLNHMLLLPILERLLPDASAGLRFAVVTPISIALSYMTFQCIERPAIAWRRGLRDKPAGANAAATNADQGALDRGLPGFLYAAASRRGSSVG
jgi:peptidoglycan/LPS O-acetylase OafA/YrhL